MEGKSLQQLLESGWRAGPHEVEHIAEEVLQILQYLKTRSLPVVPRSATAPEGAG